MLKLSLDIARTPVVLTFGENSSSYTIEEMSQAQRDKFSEASADRLIRDGDRVTLNPKKHVGARAELLTHCMRDEKGAFVPEAVIQTWPTKTVDALYSEAQKINGLVKAEEKKAGEAEPEKNLKAEDIFWFKLAARLGKTVAQLRRIITPREFQLWIEFFEWEIDNPSKDDLYMAHLIAEVQRSWVKDPKKVKVSDFILKKKLAPPTDKESRLANSKASWLGSLGITVKKRKKK